VVPAEIRRKRDALADASNEVNWCDDNRLEGENMEGAGPGGWLNVFGWYVVGTTGGGNAIVVRGDDPGVFYAAHEWYGGDTTADNTIDFEDFGGGGKGQWVSVPFTDEGMRRSLFQLAASIDDFRERADEMNALLDRID
jgi:hypothetical protein